MKAALEKFGFHTDEKQEAILKILQMAGYFKLETLWDNINHLGLKNPKGVFQKIAKVVKKCNADQGDPKQFDAKVMLEMLDGLEIGESEVMDLLLYIAQNAFNRDKGVERNELKSVDWMKAYSKEYIEAAKSIGLIDRVIPQEKEYDLAWIAGASRVGMLARIIDYLNIKHKLSIDVKGATDILTGERESWGEIDGINPELLALLTKAHVEKRDIAELPSLSQGDNPIVVEEWESYIKVLSVKFNIKLNDAEPFIKYNTDAECPKGRIKGRTYPNYAEGNGRKITETLIAQDLIDTYATGSNISLIDTKELDGLRPNTATTAVDAAQKLLADIKSGKYTDHRDIKILYQTNNPYIERQTLATQAAVDLALEKSGFKAQGYTIKLEGVGFESKQAIAVIHSEFAALMAELWKTAVKGEEDHHNPITNLLYQSRDKSPITDPMPDIDLSGEAASHGYDGDS